MRIASLLLLCSMVLLAETSFVGMYVSHYTVDAGDLIPRAAQQLLDMGHDIGLIPNRVKLEFIR